MRGKMNCLFKTRGVAGLSEGKSRRTCICDRYGREVRSPGMAGWNLVRRSGRRSGVKGEVVWVDIRVFYRVGK